MSDADKLRLLADWFDKEQAQGRFITAASATITTTKTNKEMK